MNKNRLEAFSDGVFAVAITLLVLDLPVDRDSPVPLAEQLRAEFPTFAAYVVSFLIIGTIWLNHHALFHVATGVDRHIQASNLMLLMFVAAIPFATSTYAEYIRGGGLDAKVAVLVYGIVMEGMSISFSFILARLQKAGLAGRMSGVDNRTLLVRYGIGHFLYPVITLVAWFFPPVMLLLYAIVVGYYLGPGVRALKVLDGSREPTSSG